MANFTRSSDGVMRANVRITLRYDREQLNQIAARANKEGVSIAEWLENKAALAVEEALNEDGGEYE